MHHQLCRCCLHTAGESNIQKLPEPSPLTKGHLLPESQRQRCGLGNRQPSPEGALSAHLHVQQSGSPVGCAAAPLLGVRKERQDSGRDAGQPISESAAEPWLRASAPTAGDAAEASAHHRAPSSWGSAAPKEPSPQSTTETFIENSVGQPGAPGPPAAPGTASAEQQPASIQRAHTSTRLL